MFLFQKLKYSYKHVKSADELVADIRSKINAYTISAFDTETTGLNFMTAKPFIAGFGFGKYIWTFPAHITSALYNLIPNAMKMFAHNAKFDYHMMMNIGQPIPEFVKYYDSMTVARLTEYSDSLDGIGLDDLGVKYVDPEAKFASKVIREHINLINKKRLKHLRMELKARGVTNITERIENYINRVQFVNDDPEIAALYKVPNYEDSYLENPELMLSYLADDIVLVLEYLNHALPILSVTDPQGRVMEQESKLIRVVAAFERTGLRADVQYLLDSRLRVMDYIKSRNELKDKLTGRNFNSGQHNEIKKYFNEVHGIYLSKTDIGALEEISKKGGLAGQVADVIIELRTLDKWLSTYIEGMLNRVLNGRIHTSVNNSGAVTGRVSSDLQQQPKEPLVNDAGVELFHPRRVFINDEGTNTFYFDYSQMELRLQAHYTILVSGGDTNLCRAFIPFKCTNMLTGETFDYKTHDWNSGEWIDEHGDLWKPTDLHAVTTLKAFPHLTVDHPDFPKMRKIGKMANFLKNYGGGLGAIHRQLKISEEAAQALNRGYYEAFPKVLEYQKWIEKQLDLYGFVENIFGRRYYIQDRSLYYKTYNYMIQGGCADLMKQKEIALHEFLKDKKSKMLLPIHDEMQVAITDDERWIVPHIKAIMDDNDSYIGTLPMLCDIEWTHTNWAEKEDYE